MAKRSSQELIARMQERGLSNVQIGRLIGRNDSLISQIGRGKKPGANLRDALARASRVRNVDAYVKRHGPIEPPRRTRATGEQAAVRKGAVALPEKNFSVRGGKLGVTLERRLKKAAKQGKLVSFKARYREIGTYAPTDETLDEADFAEHGWDAQAVLDKLDEFGFSENPQAAFDRLIGMNPRLEEKRGYVGYTLSTSTRKRGG